MAQTFAAMALMWILEAFRCAAWLLRLDEIEVKIETGLCNGGPRSASFVTPCGV